ncbi:cell division protein [Owenweeksia hongkongensis DSM 17368]|uniref:Cell division protein FtsX n=1 Tax=Owenweeksia hongkongensis (strain DSM 17368 / CIP 108786 / JCM 12287 / NRRL B-23963 / UST20020801) TaxID=926562 RepID=G8R2D1_OWEHD|nr:cell division protein [Owenweeksia hongkongensis DSM 17368]
MLGLFGLLVINARVIANEVKENFAITVLINNDAPEVEVRQFQKSLELTPYVKTTEFISKEEAAAELKEELDEDFMDFLGYNPLLNSIEVRLKADYVNEEQLTFLEKEYSKKSFVNEVVYDKPLIQMMNENIERIGLFLIAGSILLSLIAIALINSSIRLSIYSRRFLIKTMQLVGATKTFIRKPFIWRSLRHGLLGSLVALGFLTLLIYYVSLNVPGFTELQNPVKLALLYAGVLLTGILISMSCTFFALRKYLKLTTDQLYY